MKLRIFTKYLLSIWLAFLVPAAAQMVIGNESTLQGSKTYTFLAQGGHGDFLRLLESADLLHLVARSDITLLIPDPEILREMDDEERAELHSNKAELQAALKRHVLVGRYNAQRLAQMEIVENLNGSAVLVESDENELVVDGLILTEMDLEGANCTTHIVDGLLFSADSQSDIDAEMDSEPDDELDEDEMDTEE